MSVAVNLLRDTGIALDQQHFTWRELVHTIYRKLTGDAFTRGRVQLGAPQTAAVAGTR